MGDVNFRWFENIFYLHFRVFRSQTFIFHVFVPSQSSSALHHFWGSSCDGTLSPCSLFTLGGKATLGWLHCRNVALLLAPHHLRVFVQSVSWFIASLYPHFSSSFTSLPAFVVIIAPYGPLPSMAFLISLFIPALSLNSSIFFPSLHLLKLRSDHTLISLLSSLLPPPPSLYPSSKFFLRLTQTNQR